MFRSIRGRSTIIAMLVVLMALVVGALLLLNIYENQLVGNLDATLQQRVDDRARLIDAGSDPASLTTVLQEEAFVWIGTASGDVIATGGGHIPVDNPTPANTDAVVSKTLVIEERSSDEIERETRLMRVATATTQSGLVVVGGSELDGVDQSVSDLGKLFALAIPFIVALVGTLAWFIVERALRPVERIRTRATEITGATLADRVPVPTTKDEVHNLAVTVNNMLDRIESHDQALRQFSADASHELKSPVANIRALVDTADLAGPSWASVQTGLRNETDRLRDLVDNLLFLASHGDSFVPTDIGVVQLDELVFAEAEVAAATGGVRIDLSGVTPSRVEGSRSDLRRLMRNLVDNAVRHADERVAVTLADGNDGVTLRISDDGPGVPLEDRERIFERFTRLDEARARDDGGSGLGLSIVHQIATSHGGSVRVGESSLGGAEFVVRLPPTD